MKKWWCIPVFSPEIARWREVDEPVPWPWERDEEIRQTIGEILIECDSEPTKEQIRAAIKAARTEV